MQKIGVPYPMILFCSGIVLPSKAQNMVRISKAPGEHKLMITFDGKPFTSFLYPDSLEKPGLYPVYSANGHVVTRSFPLVARAGDPTDHPHYIGIWFNFENVNGLDFWNNSYAIPQTKKSKYGRVKTDRITEIKSGKTGVLAYHANWTDQQNNIFIRRKHP